MNTRKFLRDWRVGSNDYSTAEAAERLDIKPETLRYFVRIGVVKPLAGGRRGHGYYFSVEAIEKLEEQLAGYF